ncbi:hypothetical protein B0H03_102100 [Rathayibacter iranicus NCPPB 2253 = VKM Ac-1602]|uniref:Uncharacterized protein n=1 Tax=Rathayibacter iranicus NCPPB 2253 = VKM Ac-1602 TaxID=1328868 RepID=A0ABX5LGN6_9MICO|nr:hypothetical protein B0H03_102100 [Rathayibacter iranicus NCPPB 2253 = VKM Ac-1602]
MGVIEVVTPKSAKSHTPGAPLQAAIPICSINTMKERAAPAASRKRRSTIEALSSFGDGRRSRCSRAGYLSSAKMLNDTASPRVGKVGTATAFCAAVWKDGLVDASEPLPGREGRALGSVEDVKRHADVLNVTPGAMAVRAMRLGRISPNSLRNICGSRVASTSKRVPSQEADSGPAAEGRRCGAQVQRAQLLASNTFTASRLPPCLHKPHQPNLARSVSFTSRHNLSFRCFRGRIMKACSAV